MRVFRIGAAVFTRSRKEAFSGNGGMSSVFSKTAGADGDGYYYSYRRELSDLYLVDGLR